MLAICLLVGGFLFYWYEYRPYSIKRACSIHLGGFRLLGASESQKKAEYENCLHSYGI